MHMTFNAFTAQQLQSFAMIFAICLGLWSVSYFIAAFFSLDDAHPFSGLYPVCREDSYRKFKQERNLGLLFGFLTIICLWFKFGIVFS